MILIYTHKITKRVHYIFKLFFDTLLGVPFELTTDLEKFRACNGPKISYCKKYTDCGIYFNASNLLFESGIEGQEPGFSMYEDCASFFPVYDKKSVLPFDPFAASFFLVTRYEEYLPYIKDRFGRFDAHESVASKHGFLDKPVVNIWAEKIKSIINSQYPEVKFKTRVYKFIPTYDIDSAYSFRLKGVVRTLGGIIKALLKFDFPQIVERVKVLAGLNNDPFDTYDLQLQLQKEYALKPLYFILFAEYGEFDKNIPVNNREFQRLIKSLADYSEVGIHPSFASNFSIKTLKNEIESLAKILNREITKSRQHFLKLNFPTTYRNLINLDITDDYTMGYASETGFRAGICDPYLFYDLDLETETKLRIHPFQVMDGTLKDYQQLSPEEAIIKIKKMVDEVKAVNGTFISLWHNETLSNIDRWEGWQDVYPELLKYASNME